MDKKKVHPQITIFSKKEDMSYADYLQKEKAYLMLELSKSSEKTTDIFRGQVEKVWNLERKR